MPLRNPGLSLTSIAGADTTVTTGRSIFYGIVAWASLYTTKLWGLVIFQAFLTAGVLSIIVSLLRLPAVYLLIAAAFVACLSPASLFVGMAMPDFLAPLTVLCFALIIPFAQRLSTAEIVFLLGTVTFAMLSHKSHLALGAVLLLGSAILWPLLGLGQKYAWRGIRLACLPFVAVLGLNLAVEVAADRIFGVSFTSRPHLTAHLIDDGPGSDWVKEHCGAPAGAADPNSHDLAICDHRQTLPTEWRNFLFAKDPAVGVYVASTTTPAQQRALSEQDTQFAIEVFKNDPMGTVSFAVTEFAAQLLRFEGSGVPLSAVEVGRMDHLFPPRISDMAIDSRFGGADQPLILFDRLTVIGVAFGMAVMVFSLAMGMTGRGPFVSNVASADQDGADIVRPLVIFMVAGVVINAAVCGILAAPYDRFQARIIFLVPLAGLLLVQVCLQRLAHPAVPLKERSP
ncbi:MAG: hypothetical protein AAGH83_01755 [Pseudomonadota bacterium]